MKRKRDMYQIYYEMTLEMQDATDHIEDKVSEFREENKDKAKEKEGIIQVILKAIDEWKPNLTPSEREKILEYFKIGYKLII